MKMQWVEVDYDKPKPSLKVSTIKLNNKVIFYDQPRPASLTSTPHKLIRNLFFVYKKLKESSWFVFFFVFCAKQIETHARRSPREQLRNHIKQQLFRSRSTLSSLSFQPSFWTAPLRSPSRVSFGPDSHLYISCLYTFVFHFLYLASTWVSSCTFP